MPEEKDLMPTVKRASPFENMRASPFDNTVKRADKSPSPFENTVSTSDSDTQRKPVNNFFKAK